MARVSKEEKQASHARIVDAASRLFREQGIEATGVSEVMSAAGLTHGGFYRHFTSKEDLISAAIESAFDDIVAGLQNAIDQKGAKQAAADYVDEYLSEQHVETPGRGCPVAALGQEAGRASETCRLAIDRGSERIIETLSSGLNGDTKEARTRAVSLVSLLTGTIVLARLAGSKKSMKAILSSGRQLAGSCLAN